MTITKTSGRKYLVVVPALLVCNLLCAQPDPHTRRVSIGNKTTFREHEFLWTPAIADTLQVQDPATQKMRTLVHLIQERRLRRMDGDTVYVAANKSITPAQFKYDGKGFQEYVTASFNRKFPVVPDSIRQITITDIVIDEKGKLSYFDVQCQTTSRTYDLARPDALSSMRYLIEIEKIVWTSPDWQPGSFNTLKVKTVLDPVTVYVYPKTR